MCPRSGEDRSCGGRLQGFWKPARKWTKSFAREFNDRRGIDSLFVGGVCERIMTVPTLCFLARVQRASGAAGEFPQTLIDLFSFTAGGFAASQMEMRLLAPPVRVRDSQPYFSPVVAGVENLQHVQLLEVRLRR